MDPYENLANAIVIQAAKDYREASKTLRKKPEDGKMLLQKANAEQFFRSHWCGFLSPVDGKLLLQKLEEENR